MKENRKDLSIKGLIITRNCFCAKYENMQSDLISVSGILVSDMCLTI